PTPLQLAGHLAGEAKVEVAVLDLDDFELPRPQLGVPHDKVHPGCRAHSERLVAAGLEEVLAHGLVAPHKAQLQSKRSWAYVPLLLGRWRSLAGYCRTRGGLRRWRWGPRTERLFGRRRGSGHLRLWRRGLLNRRGDHDCWLRVI